MVKGLRFYRFVSRWSPLKGYQSKIMLIAFLGTHVPLLTLLAYFIVMSSLDWSSATRVLLIALIATLVGTGTTLYALHLLLAPIRLTSSELHGYLSRNELPTLPTNFKDEAGRLMADTRRTVIHLDNVLRHSANYDQLTGLPHISLFNERLRQAITQSAQTGHPFAVLLLDIKNFKAINNAFGMEVGDMLLKQVSETLGTVIRESDLLARMRGDQFAILDTDVGQIDGLIAQVQRILDSLSRSHIVDDHQFFPRASLGIALYPTDGTTPDTLLAAASTAMSRAHEQEQPGYSFATPDLNHQLRQRLALESDLRVALSQNEFELHYQPQVDLTSTKIVGVEALLRWHHPKRGMISPAEFIPIAEATGLIIPIGEWVLRTACQQARKWQNVGLPPLVMAVNLSARQLRQASLPQLVAAILVETGLDPAWLELEVTESMVMEDTRQATEVLKGLRALGIAVALDDFGTGYSSLSYLKTFPITTVKIDRSFVRDSALDSQSGAITHTIVSLGHSLHLKVLAEGIETGEQLSQMRDYGCDSAQGYYFSKPLPAHLLEAQLGQTISNDPIALLPAAA